MSKAQLNVAIAILLQHGQVLVGFREADQHQGNKYEFPGGKVEAGETALGALVAVRCWKKWELIYNSGRVLILFSMNMKI